VAEDWARLRAIVERALDLPEDERAGWLDEECDPDLRAQVDEWVAASLFDDRFLQSPEPSRSPEPGATVGSFHLVRVIATGGMGTVYEAEQASPQRRVALKMVRAGLAGADAQRRFRYEVEVLASLRHPGIAQVYEAGMHGELPWFAMEFVEGARTIRDFAADLDLDARVRLFAEAADAVAHGHARGVIHRDLKPDNVLVDSDGRPKVIDFGVARATGAALDARTVRTRTGEILGTITYMSPEQIEAADLDVRSDVYALGVMLFELLTGELPYLLERGDFLETASAIRSVAPRRPGRVAPELRGDLETILLKCLEKDPARRYASASALADDLRRYLARHPIAARPPSTMYQLKMLARRHKAATGALLLAVTALITGTVVSVRFALAAQDRRREAEWEAYVARIAAADASITVHQVADAKRHLMATPEALRGWEWKHLFHRLDGSEATLEWPDHHTLALGCDPTGRLVGCAGMRKQGAVRLWDLGSGAVVRDFAVAAGAVRSLAFSPDGALVALGGSRGDLRLCSISGKTSSELGGHKRSVRSLAFSTDGRVLVSGSADGEVIWWDLRTAKRLGSQTLPAAVVCVGYQDGPAAVSRDGSVWRAKPGTTIHLGARITAAAFGPQGLAYATRDAVLHVGGVVMGGHSARVDSIRFSSDFTHLVTSSKDYTVRVWELKRGQCVSVLRGHLNSPMMAVFVPGSMRVASAAGLGGVKLWDGSARAEIPTLRGHSGYVHDAAFSADSKRLVTCGSEGSLVVWDLRTRRELATIRGPGGALWSVDVDQSRIAACGDLGVFVLWDPATHKKLIERDAGQEKLRAIRLAAGRVFTAGKDGTVKVWRVADCTPVASYELHEKDIMRLELSPDGRFGASCTKTGAVRLWDAATGKVLAKLPGGKKTVVPSLSFSPDGRLLAATSLSRTVTLLETATGRVIRTLDQHAAGPFSADGRRLFSSIVSLITVNDLSTGRDIVTLRGHRRFIWRIVLSPDGETVASLGHPLPGLGGADNEIMLWETG